MELHLLIFMISLTLFVGESASTITPEEMYWKSVLPDTPMPDAIKSSLQSVGNYGKTRSFRVSEESTLASWINDNKNYKRGATRKEVDDYMKKYGQIYMLETQMAPGSTIEVQLRGPRADSISTFLPRKVADSIPFSTSKLPQILDRFSADPKSSEALAIKNTIKECHEPVTEAKTYCATSLEAMVDFVKSELGSNRVSPVSSTMLSTNANKFGVKTAYEIMRVDKLADYGSPLVVCHKTD